ncbi:hypothetical protein CCHR01_06414 [Colletotrichum chrysophilum]|uniref:Uncharacterized protein n=1 Tax=Colletotrichum chrysophilum TaxID=1836956 RepID=A0AAD9AM06_9PEZI|nr:hypothetical protein CCHR01_06414 [Colletotrichum chrysophilum]
MAQFHPPPDRPSEEAPSPCTMWSRQGIGPDLRLQTSNMPPTPAIQRLCCLSAQGTSGGGVPRESSPCLPQPGVSPLGQPRPNLFSQLLAIRDGRLELDPVSLE